MTSRHGIVAIAFASLLASAALAAGGGGGGGGGGFSGTGSSPRDVALAMFASGEKYRLAGLEALETARNASGEEREQALEQATSKFKRALREYREATRKDRRLHPAWNGMGFTQRMLGDYEAALKSYDRALEIEPGFPNAVEYRGEAYLMLGRLEDAKTAYLDLFGRERPLADLLLRKMQAWVADAKGHEQTPGAQATLDAFAKWVEERATLAEQTASLAPVPSEANVARW